MTPQVKLDQWFREGWTVFKSNAGLLLAVGLVSLLLGGVTGLILAGPMAAGVCIIVLDLFRGNAPKPRFGDLFRGFGFFLHSLMFVLVWGCLIFTATLIVSLIPILGQAASMVIGFGAQAALMFAMFLIVDRRMDFWAASVESFAMVRRNLWAFLGFGVVAALVGGLGAIACGVGLAFTWPLQVCVVAAAYLDVFEGESPGESIIDDVPPMEDIES